MKKTEAAISVAILQLFVFYICHVQAGLVAYWPLNEGSGQIVHDLSGKGNDGTLGDTTAPESADPVWINDPVRGIVLGWAGENSPSQWVNLTTHLASFRNINQGTIAAWIKIPGDDVVDVILAASDSGDPSSEIRFFYDPAYASIPGVRFDIRENGVDTYFQLSTFPNNPGDDKWHHTAVTVDLTGQVVLYVDGVPVRNGQEVGFFSVVKDLDQMSLGRNIDSSGVQWVFKGLMSDVAIFDEPLSGEQIAAIFDGMNIQALDKIPSGPYPANRAEHVEQNVILRWLGPAAVGNAVYNVYFGPDPAFPEGPAVSGIVSNSFSPGVLEPATKYYWNVEADDGGTIYKGDIWSFTTAGKASDPSPADGSERVYTDTELNWKGDSVTASYDVYFGKALAQLIFMANQADTRYILLTALEGETKYYWRIDARNSRGELISTGEVWRFTTDGFGSFFEQTDVFVSGTEGYHTYRIPAIIVAPNGELLAFCEGRKTSSSDAGDIDIVLKRSTDNGATWSPLQLVYEEGNTANITIGNPCPVVDASKGRLWLPFCRNNERVFVGYSDDSGRTWSQRREITTDVKRQDWRWYATGPGVGIQLKKGQYAGRLIIPSDHSADYGYGSHAFFSDDHGLTWQYGQEITPGCNECQAVELTDGRLMMNMRSYSPGGYRAVSTSADAGQTWSPIRHDQQLPEPTCQASFLRYSLAESLDKNRLIFSNPPSTSSRIRMTVKLSYDEGESWPAARQIYEGSSAYSCLTVLPDDTIGCLYERDNYGRITYARFSLEWLTDGADTVDFKKAYRPRPWNGAISININADLVWTAGSGATGQKIFFGINPQPGENEYRRIQDGTTFDPGVLEMDTSYYWRIDQVQSDGSEIIGDVWKFTTGNQTCTALPDGDFNGDCIVNLEDFAVLAENWMKCNLMPAKACPN